MHDQLVADSFIAFVRLRSAAHAIPVDCHAAIHLQAHRMTGEQAMWEALMGAAHPGWELRLGRNARIGSGALAMECFVYAIDVATGWMTVGTMAQAQLLGLEKMVSEDAKLAEQAKDACVLSIRAAADEDACGHGEQAERCVTAAAAAICQTHTWRLALDAQRGACAGHWIYLVYQLHAGAPLGRPVFLGASPEGLLAPQVLNTVIRHTVALDLSSPSSSVGRMIAEGDGMKVSANFRDRGRPGCDPD